MKIRGIMALATILVGFVSVSGCRRDVPAIWKEDIQSPDGAWLASARTIQDGGFGSAYIGTTVYLKRIDGRVNSGKPQEILDFDCPGPAARAYELDPANAGGTIHLTMKWASPSHLDVSYDGKATVDFQVVKFSDVDVSLRDTSKEGLGPTE
jgi:hypothetical protein